MSAPSKREPIVVTHEGGVQFAAQVRSHRIVVDQPERGGGADAGPAPIELLGVSLGTCVALYVQQYCHSRGLSHEGMRVEVQQRGAQNPSRIGEFFVKVVLPAGLPDEHLPMLERVARSCPAHGTLTHAAEVNVALVIGETAAA
ncbi:MAG: OsmC family protein [Gemmatimonadetes bacterium]|nr:OsmC family protein [Gemmatimonadota bacterium]